MDVSVVRFAWSEVFHVFHRREEAIASARTALEKRKFENLTVHEMDGVVSLVEGRGPLDRNVVLVLAEIKTCRVIDKLEDIPTF